MSKSALWVCIYSSIGRGLLNLKRCLAPSPAEVSAFALRWSSAWETQQHLRDIIDFLGDFRKGKNLPYAAIIFLSTEYFKLANPCHSRSPSFPATNQCSGFGTSSLRHLSYVFHLSFLRWSWPGEDPSFFSDSAFGSQIFTGWQKQQYLEVVDVDISILRVGEAAFDSLDWTKSWQTGNSQCWPSMILPTELHNMLGVGDCDVKTTFMYSQSDHFLNNALGSKGGGSCHKCVGLWPLPVSLVT